MGKTSSKLSWILVKTEGDTRQYICENCGKVETIKKGEEHKLVDHTHIVHLVVAE